MKILMIARSTLFTVPGGDTTQIKMTAKFLGKLGVQVDIKLSDENIDYSQYDLMHFFNIIRPADILPHVFITNIPFVVSTILVDYYEYEKKNRKGLLSIVNKVLDRDNIEYLKVIARAVKNGEKIKSNYYIYNGHRKSVKYLANKAAILLPNSHSEYRRFENFYGIKQRYQKVVNAIDPGSFNDDIIPDEKFTNHVLCVGRFEGLKNQLNLIKALLDTDMQLTLIGKPAPNHLEYFDQCKSLAANSKNIHFINQIDHQALAGIYKAAKVHVLPSWFETTGLSSLEAGVMDCNLVITPKGDTEEYFQDMAYYCQPDDVDSIRDAVLKAFQEPVNSKLKPYILNNYTWSDTANQTLQAYKQALNK